MQKQIKYLFVTIDGGGNIPPVLGLAKRLSDKGHQVNVLTEPCLEIPVKTLGLGFIPFQEHFTRTDRKEDICKDWNAKPFEKPAFENIIFGPAKIVVAATKQAVENHPTDVLVVDCMLPPALMAGEIFQMPHVVLFHMPEYMPGPNRPPGVMGLVPGKGPMGKLRDRLLMKIFNKALNRYLPKINALRISYGLPVLDNLAEVFDRADRRLIQTARGFDFPIEPAPDNVRYTGPVLDDPDWVADWQNPWFENDGSPLIVVSLSSTFQNQSETIQQCIRAIGTLEARGLVTLGPAMEDHVFDVPENVRIVQSAPHSAVFPHADLVITHAGHGTVMRALANGVPLICLPMGRDQNDNAAKVAYHGCGIRMAKNSRADKIRKAIQKILSQDFYRKNAVRMQNEINKEAMKETAVWELEHLSVRKEVTEIVS